MRLCRFDQGYGLLAGVDVIDITRFIEPAGHGDPLVCALPKLRAMAESDLASLPRRPLAGLDLLSPIKEPTKIMAAPNNYRAHLAEMKADPAGFKRLGDLEEAGLFLKATSALVGPSQGVAVRFPERRTDHEIELVAVIGKTADDIGRERALECVAGYCIGLDITLRGPEERSLRKSIDSYAVLGPWFATADEVGDVSALEMELAVNGKLRQATSLSDMVYDVPHLVAYASRFYALHPGDLVYTGTPSGVGPIRPGDVLSAKITRIGSMEVVVRAAKT